MVFSGVVGAPGQAFPNPPYTTLPQTPVSREKPYLYLDSGGNYRVFVPSLRTNSQGASWTGGATPGSSLALSQFYVAKPTDSAATLNAALAQGLNLLFTPGIYHINQTILASVSRRPAVRGRGGPVIPGRPTSSGPGRGCVRAASTAIVRTMPESATETAPQTPQVQASALSASVISLYVLTALAAVSWALVIWPIPTVADAGEIMDGAPSSSTVAIFYVTLAVAISLTAAAAFGWSGHTRNRIILIVGWAMAGAILFGISFSVVFILPFL